MVDRHKHEPEDAEIIDELVEEGETLEVEEVEAYEGGKIKKLRDSLKACEAEKMKSLEDLQRSRADFLNSKRRLEEQLERDRERIIERMIIDLIPLVDSFDTALSNPQALDELTPTWRAGIEAIHGQLKSYLKSNHVEEINPLGSTFDPHEHEAVSNVPTTEKKQIDTVIAVLQKGFKRKDVVIRPAKVAVGTEA